MVVIKFKKSIFQISAVLMCLVFMFKFPYAVTHGVTEGLKVCFYIILPSLFPFMVLSTYIIKSNIFEFAYKLLSPVSKFLFCQSACTVPVIIMSMIGGFPVGIKMVGNLLRENSITKKQAQRLCIFCMNGGPAFIITAVGVNMLGSAKAGAIMFISLCLSSFIIGIFTRFLGDKNELKEHIPKKSTLVSLSSAVSDALQSVLGICAWVVVFSAITSCLKICIENESVYTAISSFLEVTNGCVMLAGKMPIPVITAIIGFGGICVHCQVLSELKECGVKYSHFFVCRVLNGAVASFISYLLLLVFPVEIDVFASTQNMTVTTFSVSLPAFFTFAIMCIIMILDIDRKKKVW